MMERNYPTSSFADSLAPPAQSIASWAYDRSTASVKQSSSYGTANLDAELLQRQGYTSTHQSPTYTTSHLPATAALDSSSNTSETSIMSFLSAMESRSLQTGPVSASLLPPFRPPSWPAVTNSSTTELYLTGALPSTATFASPAALSSYQHTGAYPSRSYATNTSLPLQDPAFSTSNNGLFSPHDPLVHIKSSQTLLPTALAFNHLSAPTLGSALPVQSSTYRSAQESAPHLLQPQFSLLSSTLSASHGVPQPFGATVFSGSIERALQRECSVIKHHQRPSSNHAVSEQLPSSENSLQEYFSTDVDMSYQQDPSHQTPVSCITSTGEDSVQVVSRAPQSKTDSVTQAYSSTCVPKAKDCTSKVAPHPAGREESHKHSQNHTRGSPEHYSSPGQKQNSVIANQQSVRLSSLMSSSLSKGYITPHTQAQPSLSTSDKLSPLYKTLSSLSSQSENVASVSQSLVYSSSPGLSQEQEIQYGAQVQGLCQGSLSDSYPTSHSQGAPNMTYSSQSEGQASVTQSHSYASGQRLNQSLNSSYPQQCVQSLSNSNSTLNYTLMQASMESKTHAQQHTQPHKYVLSAPLSTYSSAAQALQNNVRSSVQAIKPTFCKQKLEELPIQDIDSLQQASMEASTTTNMSAHNNVIFVVSKIDDHHKTQSVIRSNSRSDDQLIGLGHANTAQVKRERMGSLGEQHIHLSSANGQDPINTITTNTSIMSSHEVLSSEQVKQHPLQFKSAEPHSQNHQDHNQAQSQIQSAHSQFITIPSTQVLLEQNQMILLQQPLLHHGQTTSKLVSVQGIQPHQDLGPVHVQYLHMDRETLGPSVTESQSQQGTVQSEQRSGCSESSKHHYRQSDNQQSNDAKNHFSLNSICFPDSMLLADDRNILSNVDDILAATVAACGVTPQDFVKTTSSTEADMGVITSPVDSKGHFQTVDIRHMSPSFSSAHHPIIANSNTMTLNGTQMATHCHGQSVQHSNSSELDANGDGGISENDYHLSEHLYGSSGLKNQIKGNEKCIKTEDGFMECPGSEDIPKKRPRSRSLTKPAGPEEDGGQAKQSKRSGQAKRQNSKGIDISSLSPSQSTFDTCPQQERIRQKIREVEEKQPEVKTGFIGSFLDFIKSGPKLQYSPSPARTFSRPRKTCTSSKPLPCALPALPPKLQILPVPLNPQEIHGAGSQQKRLDEDLQKNLETLPSFSSDEEENTGKNQALRNSICSALSALDESSDRRTRPDNPVICSMMKPDQLPTMPHTVTKADLSHVASPTATTTPNAVSAATGFADKEEESKETPSGQLALQLISVAIEGLTDEELSDSGGEGMYRERDEFVVRIEDREILKMTMRAGNEPPAIWKVQKALLQKFVPELRDRKRVFSATNSYLGYFGDAKSMYQRVYVKFLDTVNKREYVRVCSRKPRCKPMNTLRSVQVKTLLGLTASPSSVSQSQKPRPKQTKPRAEPPPKKRKKWKEEFAGSGSSAEEDELNPPVPIGSRFLSTRTMKETFKSFVELLISIAFDEDVMTALERSNDELLLPHMKRMDGMITDNRKRLLHKLHIGQVLKTALDNFPEISVVTELKKDGETPAFKVCLSGKAYNKKTMKPYKMPNKVPQEYTVDQQRTQLFALYHSLQHYKYHTYLMCKDEIASLQVQTGDLGQEETVRKCLQNDAWVEGLFDRFGDLINQVQACR